MAKQGETLFKEKVRKDLAKFGDLIWICKTQQVSLRGTPDFLCCLAGMFVALELKADEKSKTSDLQKYNIERINDAGGYGFIVYPEIWETTLRGLRDLSETQIIEGKMR